MVLNPLILRNSLSSKKEAHQVVTVSERVYAHREKNTLLGLRCYPIAIVYFSFHEDHDDKEKRDRRRRPPRDDLRDLKVETSKLDGNLNIERYLDWVQYLERIFELKEHNDEKSFNMSILRMKGYATVWHENLKRNRGREGKFKIKTWFKLKNHIDKRLI